LNPLLALLAWLLHLALMLAAAPLLEAVLLTANARLVGRAGPPLLQSWHDLRQLLQKPSIIAESASFVSRYAPAAAFAASLSAAALVPSFALGMAGSGGADLLVLVGLLALARISGALAALDAGAAFGGIGAARTMSFAAVADPALLLVAFTLAVLTGTTNLDAIALLLREGSLGLRVSLGLALLAALAVGFAQVDRTLGQFPPAELAMVREAVELEFSGRELALLRWASQLRRLLWFDFLGWFVPLGMGDATAPVTWPLGLLFWAVKTVLLASFLALLETGLAQLRMVRVAELLGLAIVLALLAAILLFASENFA
jgi:formate hydrogenlyase subunit 4